MVDLGNYNELEIAREVDFGVYLTSEDGDILLPRKYIPEGAKVGDFVRVFVYRDSEDRVIATNLKPYATVGEFAGLLCKDTSGFGAFMDWGLEKDLLVPLNNQKDKMVPGRRYCVYIYLDDASDRIVGTSKINKFLNTDISQLKEGEQVNLLIADYTDLGYNVIINNEYKGLLYRNEVFKDLEIGDKVPGYIKTIRPDDKVDVTLRKPDADTFSEMDETAARVMQLLEEQGGTLNLSDKSDPEDIYTIVGVSKKMFKRAIGSLYKEGKIQLFDDYIKLRR
ncbi:GntR family transcriptional regulator [Pontibacter sp. KCTC 32443]|uniref:CvfB family protein n=1 Tax=Pontibacter TaxID=323449 RepID=UPI00164D84B3|nr:MULTISPECIES: S1-like domain-containing RNA-binding protein [Pontibacter]MBC5775507.1 GntR family transcriptional regulator [Pontibacter sp. KCTC 32443]